MIYSGRFDDEELLALNIGRSDIDDVYWQGYQMGARFHGFGDPLGEDESSDNPHSQYFPGNNEVFNRIMEIYDAAWDAGFDQAGQDS